VENRVPIEKASKTALLLGASNTQVGLLAALGPATQVLQLPTVALIERWRRRKVICWWAALIGRTAALGILVLYGATQWGSAWWTLPAVTGTSVGDSGNARSPNLWDNANSPKNNMTKSNPANQMVDAEAENDFPELRETKHKRVHWPARTR